MACLVDRTYFLVHCDLERSGIQELQTRLIRATRFQAGDDPTDSLADQDLGRRLGFSFWAKWPVGGNML